MAGYASPMDVQTRDTSENGGSEPLWGRQEGESDRAFEAFAMYRDLGPARSTRQVAQAVAKSAHLIRRWSARWAWVQRAGAWDDEADRNQRERDLVERQAARARMLAAHARGGAALHEIGCKALDRFDTTNLETAEEARARIEKLSPLDAARLMETGARLERLARDDSNRRITDPEAQKFVDGLLDVCLRHLPPERAEAFLVDFEAQLGLGI
jgi:hypothetical protein